MTKRHTMIYQEYYQCCIAQGRPSTLVQEMIDSAEREIAKRILERYRDTGGAVVVDAVTRERETRR